MRIGACAVAFACAIIQASAKQIFSNNGTTSGWTFINHEHKGTVREVTNVVYQGSTAIKATQIYDPDYTGRYHSEVAKFNVYRWGDQGFYGFAFRLQRDWQFDSPQTYNIAQFIADFGDTGCDDWMPSSMVWLQGDQLYSRVRFGTICDQQTTTYQNLADVTAGEWHKIVIQSSWATGGEGFYKIWYDGKKILDKQNIDTTVEDDRYFSFRVGLYANGWHDDHQMKGTQGTRSVWVDKIAAGTRFADADPDQW